MKLPVAIQLYSVRDAMEKDFAGTLRKIADLGYKGVEFAGFGGFSAVQIRDLLKELGLTPAGSHTGIDALRDNLDEIIEYNLTIGNKYIICPYNQYKSKEEYISAAKFYDECGEKIRARGLEFLYHNHDFEFMKFDGEYGLDIIFKNVKPENVGAELDLGWIFYAGIDPAAFLRSFKKRCPLVHIKDFLSAGEKTFTEIGNGLVDTKGIAAAAVETGVEWLIVEQDVSNITSMESARINLENLKKIGLA
jgi:sugar phosphate isomerase/epimerase